MIGLPFTAGHERWTPGEEDSHGNTTPAWLPPTAVRCFWWVPTTTEPQSGPVNSDRAVADAVIVIESGIPVDPRDRFILDGRRYEVVGEPKDYDHGPFGFRPGRRPIDLRRVEG